MRAARIILNEIMALRNIPASQAHLELFDYLIEAIICLITLC